LKALETRIDSYNFNGAIQEIGYSRKWNLHTYLLKSILTKDKAELHVFLKLHTWMFMSLARLVYDFMARSRNVSREQDYGRELVRSKKEPYGSRDESRIP
jgi:hypothetical protein